MRPSAYADLLVDLRPTVVEVEPGAGLITFYVGVLAVAGRSQRPTSTVHSCYLLVASSEKDLGEPF